ncbi:hypothetical protein H7F15_19150 [Pontibacter sp. Tf4]|uniref:hypothetical protein n=1 Tax=Pontibacter sp. Tf4 TaxID=2761620 RepID=UPI0016248870|nr:hypothetical protein [Pontibacter sp. Tf4]MBB6613165.1 hypothetical protein [Pontibacter sp. Tf4]
MEKDLIEEYKSLAATCARTDYSDKASVKNHNKAVGRMSKIVEKIATGQTPEKTAQFIDLLNIPEHKTSLWAAIHILEKLSVNKENEQKALSVINLAAQGDSADALGYQYWLKNWKQNQK